MKEIVVISIHASFHYTSSAVLLFLLLLLKKHQYPSLRKSHLTKRHSPRSQEVALSLLLTSSTDAWNIAMGVAAP